MSAMAFKKFLGRNLEATNRGSEGQFENMIASATGAQQAMNDLSDQLSGNLKAKSYKQGPKTLVDSLITDIVNIVTTRKGIERQ
jgi:hypothetical protein